MKISISGTYSAGQHVHRGGVVALHRSSPHARQDDPRDPAGDLSRKKLAEVTPAEFLQLMLRRHTGRTVAEAPGR